MNYSCQKDVQKGKQKLHASYGICNYMTLSQRRIIMKAFIESQFYYCLLVWIFHDNRNLNNTMNNIQALHLIYTGYHSSYDQLLAKDSSFRIHHQKISNWNL